MTGLEQALLIMALVAYGLMGFLAGRLSASDLGRGCCHRHGWDVWPELPPDPVLVESITLRHQRQESAIGS